MSDKSGSKAPALARAALAASAKVTAADAAKATARMAECNKPYNNVSRVKAGPQTQAANVSGASTGGVAMPFDASLPGSGTQGNRKGDQ